MRHVIFECGTLNSHGKRPNQQKCLGLSRLIVSMFNKQTIRNFKLNLDIIKVVVCTLLQLDLIKICMSVISIDITDPFHTELYFKMLPVLSEKCNIIQFWIRHLFDPFVRSYLITNLLHFVRREITYFPVIIKTLIILFY